MPNRFKYYQLNSAHHDYLKTDGHYAWVHLKSRLNAEGIGYWWNVHSWTLKDLMKEIDGEPLDRLTRTIKNIPD